MQDQDHNTTGNTTDIERQLERMHAAAPKPGTELLRSVLLALPENFAKAVTEPEQERYTGRDQKLFFGYNLKLLSTIALVLVLFLGVGLRGYRENIARKATTSIITELGESSDQETAEEQQAFDDESTEIQSLINQTNQQAADLQGAYDEVTY